MRKSSARTFFFSIDDAELLLRICDRDTDGIIIEIKGEIHGLIECENLTNECVMTNDFCASFFVYRNILQIHL